MTKIKLAIIFGGMSTEHEISIISGKSIIKNLDKEKYKIYPIYIDRKGKWHKSVKELEEIQNPINYLKQMDCIFPVLHGLYGEDGSMQGLFELLKIPYVGCKILTSAISMDKVYTKVIFEKAKLNQAPYIYVRKEKEKYIYVEKNLEEIEYTIEELTKKAEQNLKYPMFVKPSNSGSSIGISKVKNEEELIKAIKYANKFDKKVLIEKEIKGREVECAILGNNEPVASCIGEILPAEEFYSYDSKYNNKNSKIQIPANLSEDMSKQIRNYAIKAYKAVDARNLARVDFFIENETNKIIINEINTMPGFTPISMYPQLFKKSGISYSALLDKLINLAME